MPDHIREDCIAQGELIYKEKSRSIATQLRCFKIKDIVLVFKVIKEQIKDFGKNVTIIN